MLIKFFIILNLIVIKKKLNLNANFNHIKSIE